MAKHWSDKYMNMTLNPITKTQIESLRKDSAKYIFVHDKEGNATCSCCEKDINVGHTRHLQTYKCPKCGKEMKVQHEWRMSKKLRNINWIAVSKALDAHTMVIRYVMFSQYENKPYRIAEHARMYISDQYTHPEHWEYDVIRKAWVYGRKSFFRIHAVMNCWIRNPYECWTAKEFEPTWFKEINKLDCFKYYPAEKTYDKTRMVSQMHYNVRYARLNEMCSKLGFDTFAEENFRHYLNHHDNGIQINPRKTSFKGMLRLSNAQYKLFASNPKMNTYDMLRVCGKNRTGDAEYFISHGISTYTAKDIMAMSRKSGASITKICDYVGSQGISTWELSHYWSVLNKLGIDNADKNYRFPKNFRKTEEDINREYNLFLVKQEAEKNKEKDAKIRLISEGIKKNMELMGWLNGTNGLQIFVPECVADLAMEGINLHNCIGTYVDRIIEGRTMVFFVRKTDDPTASYVAFEYCNGEVIQLRGDYNKAVEDTKVINFVDAFAERLRHTKVARVA